MDSSIRAASWTDREAESLEFMTQGGQIFFRTLGREEAVLESGKSREIRMDQNNILLSVPYRVKTARNAESGYLTVSAADSGKLICDRRMTFGCYATKTRGALKEQYEVMVTGSDLTEDELFFAESFFSGYQGRCKVRNVPSACADSPAAGGNAALVRYAKTIKGNDGISTYEIYSGPDKASAFAFLNEKNVSRRYYYIIVDTPEGSFGKDCIGFYQE